MNGTLASYQVKVIEFRSKISYRVNRVNMITIYVTSSLKVECVTNSSNIWYVINVKYIFKNLNNIFTRPLLKFNDKQCRQDSGLDGLLMTGGVSKELFKNTVH